ncbi:MAG: hypothetical protein IT436_04145 [Phycisphaerales bacterium]|nr:hypothetical protein [Phycisphaerales bacterium]
MMLVASVPLATVFIAGAAGPAAAQCTEQWVQVNAAGPSPRAGHQMVYDSVRGRVVLFGGKPSGSQAFNDTWEWDGGGWQQISPTEPIPAPRAEFAMAYDSVRGAVVVFGGEIPGVCWTNPIYDDTWEWDGVRWEKQAPETHPDARTSLSGAFDAARGRAVLFSGAARCLFAPADTWLWDGLTWRDGSTAGPAARSLTALAYDPVTASVMMFGGHGASDLNDLWQWNGVMWQNVQQTSPPPGRYWHAMVAVPAGLLVFGGTGGSACCFGETHLFTGGGWTALPGPSPSARAGHAMAYDSDRDEVVLFGGAGASGPRLNDTWIWSSRPVFSSHPVDVSTCPHQNVSFTAIVRGATTGGPYIYQWQIEDPRMPESWLDLSDGVLPGVGLLSGTETATLNVSDTEASAIAHIRLMVSNTCGQTISAQRVLRVCPADTNCDGTVDFADYLEFLNLFDAEDPRIDFNQDGLVDFGDYLEFLNHYDGGC